MTKFQTLVFFLLMLCSLPAAYAKDCKDPEARVKSIISELKKTRKQTSLLKYVDWTVAYSELSDEEKNAFGVESASSLKSIVHEMLSNPAALMRKQIKQKHSDLSPEQQAALDERVRRSADVLARERQVFERAMGALNVNIEKSSIKGDLAAVWLSSTWNEEEFDSVVKLVCAADTSWYLKSPDLGEFLGAKFVLIIGARARGSSNIW